MLNFIISIILGLIPEVLYFTLFLVYTKNLKTKRLKLFILLAIGYIVLIMICRYQLIFYLSYIVYIYLINKILYKAHISDIFVISLGSVYLTITSFIAFKITENYYLAYIINRIILYTIFLIKNKFNPIYKLYLSLWNRNDNAKIKSITLRNISLLVVNVFILILNYIIIIALNYFSNL